MILITEDDAFDEFCDLIISDPAENYIYNNYIKKGFDFYYLSTKFFQWCRDYEDLKHIVRSKIPITSNGVNKSMKGKRIFEKLNPDSTLKDFLNEAEKEKKELEESYKESKRQTEERKLKENNDC